VHFKSKLKLENFRSSIVLKQRRTFWWQTIMFESGRKRQYKHEPFVGKNHHPIISFWTDYTAHTLCSLSLLKQKTNVIKCSSFTKISNRMIIEGKKESLTKASNVRKSPSLIWKVSRRYSRRASKILKIYPSKFCNKQYNLHKLDN
jgi:hypothetical protein